MSDSFTRIPRCLLALGLALGLHGNAFGAVAATGAFGINVNVPFPFTSGTFDGDITSFNMGPFDVGGTPVNLMTGIGTMSITNGQIPQINIPALAATFNFDAGDDNGTANNLDFDAAGVAICDNAITCSQGQGTFVADVTGIADPNGLLPDGFVYTFDGDVTVSVGPYDATGVFGLNAFAPVDVPMSASPSMISSDPTTYFDSRKNTLRDFLVELTFAGVTSPGTVTFLGKSAMPGSLPASISVIPDLSIFIDIVTGGGFAFTPPVDVCIAYEDTNPADGVVDGTDVLVVELKVLHALATGQDFQDVTTTVGNGKVCGQVGTLSPFLIAKGPAPTTTSTTTTTVTTSSLAPTTTTTLPELLGGKKLLLKDKSGKPQKRGLDCLAKTPITLGDGNQSGDDPVVNGGSVRVRGASFDNTYDLAKSGWKYQGKAGQDKGYKFKGSTIKSVMIKKGKLLHVVGKGSSLGHSLTADPKPVSVTLTIGARKYCLTFPSGDFKEGTKWLAKDAAKPAECASPSGAFID